MSQWRGLIQVAKTQGVSAASGCYGTPRFSHVPPSNRAFSGLTGIKTEPQPACLRRRAGDVPPEGLRPWQPAARDDPASRGVPAAVHPAPAATRLRPHSLLRLPSQPLAGAVAAIVSRTVGDRCGAALTQRKHDPDFGDLVLPALRLRDADPRAAESAIDRFAMGILRQLVNRRLPPHEDVSCGTPGWSCVGASWCQFRG